MTKRVKKPRVRTKVLEPTGIAEVDRLAGLSPTTIQDYISAASAYVRTVSKLEDGPKKAAQIRLSHALARSFETEVVGKLPRLKGRLVTEEQTVAGGLRTAKADVSESHPLDGLRLAVELKPVNLAVGRAIWNRFGDLRSFAVNIHLKFPFAVVGGVLVIPTYEEVGTQAAQEAEMEEAAVEQGDSGAEFPPFERRESTPLSKLTKKPTIPLIDRAVERLIRAGGRRSEAESAHLLEGIAVVAYDPDTATIVSDLPKPDSGLRWEEFIIAMVTSYRARFED